MKKEIKEIYELLYGDKIVNDFYLNGERIIGNVGESDIWYKTKNRKFNWSKSKEMIIKLKKWFRNELEKRFGKIIEIKGRFVGTWEDGEEDTEIWFKNGKKMLIYHYGRGYGIKYEQPQNKKG